MAVIWEAAAHRHNVRLRSPTRRVAITTYPILSLARSGATSRAWDAFVAAGLDGVEEVNALTLKGRLLKDRARQAAGTERAALFALSGAAYRKAATLRPDSYPLINAAAMALFAGDGATAAAVARDVLTLVDGDPAQGETPYWREATRAEAMLLLGRIDDAKTSLSHAINAAPQAWEDHAATLRQFAAILLKSGADIGWLDAHRPPPSLHFSGILGIDPGDTDAANTIHSAIAALSPGFGFGALAAGADIIAAEAILAAGGELHVVLPSSPDVFCQSSVAPYGKGWTARFDALCAAAHSLTICTADATTSRAGIMLADNQAMGMALSKAQLLKSQAIAVRIEPQSRPSLGDPWQASGSPIIHVEVAESRPVEGVADLDDGQLLYIVALADDAGLADPMGFATLDEAMAAIPANHPHAALDCTTSGQRDIAAALLRSTPIGQIFASKAAAMALLAAGQCRRIEPMGEMETHIGPIDIYAIWPGG